MRKVLCILLLFCCLASAATEHPAQVAGIYEGTLAVKNADGRKITLNLKQDGASEFRDGAKTIAGHWSVTRQDLRVEADGGSAPMQWKIGKNMVVLKNGSKADYGKRGLTLRRPR